jgi:hypothetical protein
MKTVKMFANGAGVKEFTPEHALNILQRQIENHIPERCCWRIDDDKWEFSDGMLRLKKKSDNESQRNTGIGSEAPKRKRDTKGTDPQP